MPKYEYLHCPVNEEKQGHLAFWIVKESRLKTLNDLGEDGWELVTIFNQSYNTNIRQAIFKREKK